MKPIQLFILLVIVALGIYAAVHFSSQGGDDQTTEQTDQESTKDAPALEERYGFTGETVDP